MVIGRVLDFLASHVFSIVDAILDSFYINTGQHLYKMLCLQWLEAFIKNGAKNYDNPLVKKYCYRGLTRQLLIFYFFL